MKASFFKREAKFLLTFIIIVNIVGYLYVYFIGPLTQRKQKKVLPDIKVIVYCLQQFEKKEKRFPTSIEELQNIPLPVQQRDSIGCPIRDPWGKNYLLFKPPDQTVILTTGPNRILENHFTYGPIGNLEPLHVSANVYELIGNGDDRIFAFVDGNSL